jgi:hypothetical protein
MSSIRPVSHGVAGRVTVLTITPSLAAVTALSDPPVCAIARWLRAGTSRPARR